ncbi:cytochrome ubiquinol oxidase subunit II [Aureimonas jatrophae]|uniref:Cytochrome o ubiquinol oxidase subunit 2 n=1 Tax=Aureimonas jatrophae TaxID=1166073 RepID=A0A1H0DK56_9HYPH|nr:cytochrome ubiquinol oxidase subunit II [Aureimonas jatrophae]MBB3951937.1 cytochrome o ubiquinol oxidase subunit 2 [Aureimonas jatrophae]SDN70483.1 cytochrome o ubiquinol oxidase subunit 2 [Aureimonas jatrophae]
MALPLALAGCAMGPLSFFDPLGPVAAAQRSMFFQVVAWMSLVVVPVLVLVPLFAWRYRRTNTRARYTPDWGFSWPIEIAIWVVPIIIVIVLGGVIWKARSLDPYRPIASAAAEAPLEIEVVGLDWKWLFIYPDERIASVGTLAIPAGRPVRFRLTSDTVMQSFAIPALGSQIYAMAGMVTELNLLADRPGERRGHNTQFNGMGFQNQRFSVSALPAGGFADFVRAAQLADRPLDDAALATLTRQGSARDAAQALGAPGDQVVFSQVPPDLFARFVARHRPAMAHEMTGGMASSTVPLPVADPMPEMEGAHDGH